MNSIGVRALCAGCGAAAHRYLLVSALRCDCGSQEWHPARGLVWAATDVASAMLHQLGYLVLAGGTHLGAAAHRHPLQAWLLAGVVALTLADRWGWM